jgi:eukaryotic-like serine/threonine-protein kinase
MMSQLVAGNTLGRYELLIPVAKGGMAQVWAARLRGTRGFQKLVAIKTILAGAIDNTRLEQMFLAEAQLASQVLHPNVVGTLELGEHEGMLYLVMEWVDGEPVSHLLTQSLEHGGLPMPIAVNLIAQACQGLHAAHELRDDNGNLLGVVHRDVSPQNLLVTLAGTAKLVDFGVAKATARAGNLTEIGEIKGKFSYMAPEQVQAQQVDRRADIFALGILAYLLTTGKHPFRGASPGETVKNIMSTRPPQAPSEMMPDYPPELEAVIMKALEKSPERRFASAEDMFTALEDAMPEALEASFQAQVASYMTKVMGARVNQRRAALRQAQEVADRHRTEQGASSVGTLRAISLDSIPDPTGTPSRSHGVGLGPVEGSGSNPFAAASSSKRYVAGGLALLGVCAAILALRWGPSPAASGASASPVAADAALLPSASPVTTQAAAGGLSRAAIEPEEAPIDPSDLEPEKSKKVKPAQGRAGKGVVAAAAAPLVASAAQPAVAAPQTPANAAPAAPAPAVKTAPSTNAWDRDAFGGRH